MIPLGAVAMLFTSCAGPGGFTIADTDESGAVSPDEFKQYMLEAIFAEVDSNGDAKVTFEEWRAANPSGDESKFTAPDTNRDKTVTPAEAKDHFEREGTMKELFSRIDTNGDGSLSREEVAAFKSKLAAESGTKLEKLSKTQSANQ